MNYNYNSYGNGYYPYMYGQYGYQQYPQYQGTQSRQSAQQIQQPQQSQQPQQFDLPILDIKFVTSEEAKSYIMFPNTNVLLIDRQNKIAYLKSADNLGQSSMKGFRYEEEIEQSNEKVQNQLKENQQLNQMPIDTNIFVKKEELSELVTKADLNGFITKEEYQNLLTQIDNLKRKLKINEILESEKNGKQTNGNEGLGRQQSSNGQNSGQSNSGQSSQAK